MNMTVNYHITLDAKRSDLQTFLKGFKVGETGSRSVEIALTDGGKSMNIPEGAVAVLAVRRPDGVPINGACTVDAEKGVVNHTFTSSELECAGTVLCELRLMLLSDDGKESCVLTSPKFSISVTDQIYSADATEGSDEFDALTKVLTEADNLNISVSGNTITVTGKDGVEKVIELKNGEPGPKGDDGISVVGVLVNAQNHLIITLSDSSTVDAGDIGVDAAVDKKLTEQKGVPNGVAELDANKRLPESQLPYFVLHTNYEVETVKGTLSEIYEFIERNNALVAVFDESGYHYDTHSYRIGRFLIIEYFVFDKEYGNRFCKIKWDSVSGDYTISYENSIITNDEEWDNSDISYVRPPTAYMIDKRKQDKIADLEAIRSGAAAGAKAIPAEQKGAAKGVAELDENGKVPSAQLPSYVDDVLEYTNQSAFPSEGESGKIYIAQDTNKTYRWGGTAYAEISASLALGETSSTAYRGDKGKAAYEHSQKTSGNPHGVTKADVGLNNVDNTSDLDKPVSVLQKAAIDAKYTKPTGGIPKADLAQEVQDSLEKADKEDLTNFSLGIHTDGFLYIFYKGEPFGSGVSLPSGATGDVVGNVDSANNIIVTGALADGTYTVKYEMEDGTTIDIGELVLDSNIYYSITNNLTNCVNSNSATQAIEGESYSATITANNGYELSSIVVTMGGSGVTVTDGVINITSVTGNIVITAVAEEIVSRQNFAGTLTVGRLSNSATGNIATDSPKRRATDYIAIQKGDVLSVTGYDATDTGSAYMVFNASKIKVGTMTQMNTSSDYVTLSGITTNGCMAEIISDSVAYIRFSGEPTGSESDIVVNIKRNGEWL